MGPILRLEDRMRVDHHQGWGLSGKQLAKARGDQSGGATCSIHTNVRTAQYITSMAQVLVYNTPPQGTSLRVVVVVFTGTTA